MPGTKFWRTRLSLQRRRHKTTIRHGQGSRVLDESVANLNHRADPRFASRGALKRLRAIFMTLHQ